MDALEVLVEEVVKCPAAELVLPSPAEPSPPPGVFARPAAPAQPEALCTSQPIALPGGGLRPGLRSKEIKGLPVASFRVVRPRDGEPCDSDASEELDDAAFEHRHQRLASIERKGFSVMGRKREPVLTLAAASSAPAPSGDEREIRRSVQMLLGRSAERGTARTAPLHLATPQPAPPARAGRPRRAARRARPTSSTSRTPATRQRPPRLRRRSSHNPRAPRAPPARLAIGTWRTRAERRAPWPAADVAAFSAPAAADATLFPR